MAKKLQASQFTQYCLLFGIYDPEFLTILKGTFFWDTLYKTGFKITMVDNNIVDNILAISTKLFNGSTFLMLFIKLNSDLIYI